MWENILLLLLTSKFRLSQIPSNFSLCFKELKNVYVMKKILANQDNPLINI